MTGILMLDSLTRGNTLKQGDKTPLTYKLLDADGDNLSIAGKTATVRLVHPNYLTIGYEKTGLTVQSDDTVTFTIDKIIPARKYHVEIIVDNKFVFPSRSVESKFTIDRSSLGTESNIIEIVGKEVLINAVKSRVDTELQPLVTSMEAAQQAEAQRVTAESTRVSAEAQRKTDHANRSAELARKADKIKINNLITLPNTERTITKDPEATHAEDNLTNYLTDNIKVGDKYYVSVDVKSEGNSGTAFFYSTGGSGLHYVSGNTTSNYRTISKIITGANRFALVRISNIPGRPQATNLTYQNLYTLNLTEIFGAGNEPTVEGVEELLKFTGRIDGEYALNNKEMLGYLMKGIGEKANKKQEDWITPTLLNGWVRTSGQRATAQYLKDQFGFVHIRGDISNGSGSIFQLPTGYRPTSQQIFLVGAGLNNEVSKIRISTDGILTFHTSPVPASVQLNISFDLRS